MYSVTVEDRDFAPKQHNFGLSVLGYSHHRIGGPELATATVTGGPGDLWGLFDWLRYGLTIHNGAEPIWWGYVETVTLALGGVEIGLSLREMYNRIAVTYSHVAAGSADVGERKTTSYTTDSYSRSTFGAKSLLASVDGASDAQAEQTRDTLLQLYRHPVATVRPGSGGDVSATLECRGWWSVLAWLNYSNSGTASTVTTTQISDIYTDYNGTNANLISGVNVLDASGVSSSQYRDGDTSHLDEITALLKTGTTNDLPLQATITPSRLLRVAEQPSRTDVRYYLRSDGALVDRYGQPLTGSTSPAGEWCGLWDVLSNTTAAALLSNATPFLIDRCEYDPRRERWTIEPVGMPSPWEVVRL